MCYNFGKAQQRWAIPGYPTDEKVKHEVVKLREAVAKSNTSSIIVHMRSNLLHEPQAVYLLCEKCVEKGEKKKKKAKKNAGLE